MKKRTWNEYDKEVVKRARQLYKRGWKPRHIAASLGLKPKAVRDLAYRNDWAASKKRWRPMKPFGPDNPYGHYRALRRLPKARLTALIDDCLRYATQCKRKKIYTVKLLKALLGGI